MVGIEASCEPDYNTAVPANGIQLATLRRKGMSRETLLKSQWGISAAADFFSVEVLT